MIKINELLTGEASDIDIEAKYDDTSVSEKIVLDRLMGKSFVEWLTCWSYTLIS